MDKLNIKGTFDLRIKRKDGIIFKQTFNNGIVDEGKNAILNTMFRSEAAASWYVGLIVSLTTLSNSDTMASHTGWSEYTNYDETARQEWAPDSDASDKVIQNSQAAYAEFTIDDLTTPTLKGLFICNDNTKSGVTGTLWCTAQLATPITLNDGDIIQIQYKLGVN